MTTHVTLLTWPAIIALANANPSADVTATGSGMVVHLSDGDYVGIRPEAAA